MTEQEMQEAQKFAKVIEDKIDDLVTTVLPNDSTQIGQMNPKQTQLKYAITRILVLYETAPSRKQRRKIERLLN